MTASNDRTAETTAGWPVGSVTAQAGAADMAAGWPAGLTFVGDRCCDHSPSSGYDQVCSLFPAAGWLSGRALEAGEERWIRAAAEPAVPSLLHVFYGDCSGSAAVPILRERWPGETIVLTVHQPVERMRRDTAAMRACADADAILTVSERQATELAALDLQVPVRAIAHGVWTHRFAPAGGAASSACVASRREVLLVGNYLRDWPVIDRIVDLLATRGVRCRLVGTNAPGERFAGYEWVTVSPKLSERELADAYDGAAALLMPVLDTTASNALLEAMSAGCPVICNEAPSLVDEYLGDRIDAFEAGDCDAAVDRLLRYVASRMRGTHGRGRCGAGRALRLVRAGTALRHRVLRARGRVRPSWTHTAVP